MNTLSEDLLGLVAKLDPDAFQSMYISSSLAMKATDEYMKNAHYRVMEFVKKHIHPTILKIIVDYNLTITGSFILQALCNLTFESYDLDLISTQDLSEEIIDSLFLEDKRIAHKYDNIEMIRHIYTNKSRTMYNMYNGTNFNEMDFIVLQPNQCVLDLLETFDFDFVKNSLEFLPNGGTRLTIMCPSSLFSRKSFVDLDCYGIMGTTDRESIIARFARLYGRTDKYRCRGFSIKADVDKLDLIIGQLKKYKLGNYIGLVQKRYQTIYELFDDLPLIKSPE